MQNKIFKIKGKVQHYAWGGKNYIPNLLHFNNADNKPCAEYWMGAHPSAPAIIEDSNPLKNIIELINENPKDALTENIYNSFGELPFLFKVLDVNEMLSIQVHPTKVEAEKGFDREEAEGVAINAPHRNYKDRNHKPEVMIALGEFWLLHGFKSLPEIENTLSSVQEFNFLLPLFKKEGLKALYKFWMELSQQEVNTVLLPLVKKEIRHKQEGNLNKSMPGWWVNKLYEAETGIGDIDKGIFSIYIFNIVGVKKGEGVFQAAGVPHAYLEGQNIELMANSDNVLRGGLTPKHVDVPELMKHTIFEPVTPKVLKGDAVFNGMEKHYPCPVPDFSIAKIELQEGNVYTALSSTPEIYIAIEGGIIVNSNEVNITIKKGECFMVLPQTEYAITSSGHCELYKAFV